MIVVTGGAGFIGSAVICELNSRGEDDILVVVEKSSLDSSKLNNLKNLKYNTIIGKNDFIEALELKKYEKISAIIHMGACSKTTETDNIYIRSTNYEYTKKLVEESLNQDIQFIYASSAATYGDGKNGFSDKHNTLDLYSPLNIYGQSKHDLDLWAYSEGYLDKIVGLKYFNVYGPNEYHKGTMKSFVPKAYEQIKTTGKVKLFKSYHPDYADGLQKRDFIYIKDVVNMTLHFLDNPSLKGLYNIGTGTARSWNDLVQAVFKALDIEENIEYIDMPENIKEQYQYYTQADMNKFIATNYSKHIRTLEEGVEDYVLNYLKFSYDYLRPA